MKNRLLLIISVYLASIATPSFAIRPEGTQTSTTSSTETNQDSDSSETTASKTEATKSETTTAASTSKSGDSGSKSSGNGTTESVTPSKSETSSSSSSKTETPEIVAPRAETSAPVVANTPKVETPAANPVSAVKAETAAQTPKAETPTVVTTTPKVETPAANPVSEVKTETAAQTPKAETPAVVTTSPKVETPAANPIAISAPSVSLSAPAPNPVYIAPKVETTEKTDSKTTVDKTSTDTKKDTVVETEVKDDKKDDKTTTAVENTKDKVTPIDTIFMAKDDAAKTCPNTPAIVDIGSNDEIKGVGTYRTTFHVSNGSSVTNNWDGYGKDGTVTYVPSKDFRGLDSFTYTIRDQDGNTSVATVSMDVSCDETGFSSVSSCSAYAISDDYSLMPVVVHRTQLLKIDQDSGQVTTIGAPLPPKEGIEGLAISPITHTMYAISGGYAAKSLNGSLYRVNSSTGEIQLVGETGFKGTSSLAFRNDGSLWAWSNSGLISIDPSTAKSSLVFSSDKNFEGLAWSSDGKTLYASKFASLWAYDGTDVKRICNNFPDEVESLETLGNGLLMYALSQQRVDAASNALYVYDPKQCKVISSVPVGGHRDIESLAWAYDCQSHAASTSGTVKFEGAAETQMCLEPSQWLEVKGTVSLQSASASAQLQTVWQVIEPPQSECPDGECKQAQVKTQVVTGDSAFYIKGWWDGLKKQSAVKLRYTAKLLDMQGQPLAGSGEVSKTLVATAEACGKAGSSLPAGVVGQPAADTNALQSYFKEMGLKQFSIDDHGKLSVTFDGKTHYGMFSFILEQGSANAEQKLTLKAIPDANADGVDDFVVIYPNGQTQLLLYLGNQ
ncbi:MAG: cadherin-like domain-containing protein [Thiotrichaceae bacterium]|nr:cadherin-like domain-containing protein [Thiotrichaceae bacterium]